MHILLNKFRKQKFICSFFWCLNLQLCKWFHCFFTIIFLIFFVQLASKSKHENQIILKIERIQRLIYLKPNILYEEKINKKEIE